MLYKNVDTVLFVICAPMGSNFSLSCGDCMCGPWRREDYFDGMSKREAQVILVNNALGIDVLNTIQLIFFLIWLAMSIVAGFTLYDGNSTANVVSNIGWWACIDVIVLIIGARATGFKLHCAENDVLELNIASTTGYLVFYAVMLIVAAVASLVHLALLLAEMINGSGTLATLNPATGWVFFAILILMVIVDVWLFVRVLFYRSNVNYANYRAFELSNTADVENPPASTEKSLMNTGSRVTTPGLEMLRKNKNRKQRE